MSTSTPLMLATVCVNIPHPDKMYKHGEDGYFVSTEAFGVFDGVGGSASDTVDPGIYASELAELTDTFLRQSPNIGIERAVREAVRFNTKPGSSTLCTGHLSGNALHMVSVGDSGLIVVSGGKLVFSTQAQEKGFNYPLQVSALKQGDLKYAENVRIPVYAGDVIVCASDGLWDNLFKAEVTEIVSRHTQNLWNPSGYMKNETFPMTKKLLPHLVESHLMDQTGRYAQNVTTFRMSELAIEIATRACIIANSQDGVSPFTLKCRDDGKVRYGGKLDDITVIVSFVVPRQEPFVVSHVARCPLASCRQSTPY